MFKVPKTKGISLNIFDKFVCRFKFGVRIRQLDGISDLCFVANKGLESCLENLIEVGASLCYQSKEMIRVFLLQVEKQELIKVVVTL